MVSAKEYTAKTIEDALEIALNEMMLTRDNIEYEVISHPSKGFLGIGGRPAVIRVKKKIVLEKAVEQDELKPVHPLIQDEQPVDAIASDNSSQAEIAQEKENYAATGEKKLENVDAEQLGRDFLQKIFDEMQLNVQVDVVKKDNYLTFNLSGENLGILIGRRGDTLDALQFLLNLVINDKAYSKIKGIIDVENYRQKREETLIGLSHKLANKAKKTGQKVVLEPMNPQERRIIHMALQDDYRVTTYSEGEEPYRKVVIVPEKKYNPKKSKPQT